MKKLLTVACMAMFASPAYADSVEDAFALCAAMDGTGLLSERCDVSGWGSSVNLRIDTVSSEAREICQMVVDMADDGGLHFEGRWTLNIRSPYSGDNTIAYCTLR